MVVVVVVVVVGVVGVVGVVEGIGKKEGAKGLRVDMLEV